MTNGNSIKHLPKNKKKEKKIKKISQHGQTKLIYKKDG